MIVAGRLHIVQGSVGDQLRFHNIPTENQIDAPEQSFRAVSKTSSCLLIQQGGGESNS